VGMIKSNVSDDHEGDLIQKFYGTLFLKTTTLNVSLMLLNSISLVMRKLMQANARSLVTKLILWNTKV